MADHWAEKKKAWSSQSKDLNLGRGFVSRAGWARCGFQAGELVQRGVVLTDRFCSKCGWKNPKFDADAADLYKQFKMELQPFFNGLINRFPWDHFTPYKWSDMGPL